MSTNRKRKITEYLKHPELRFFWLFLFFAAAFFVADVVYAAGSRVLVDFGALVLFGALVFWMSVRLAGFATRAVSSAGRVENIIANLGEGIVSYDNNFKMIIFNAAAEEMFGVRQEQVVGQTFGPERASEPQFRLLTQAIFPSLAPVMVRRSEPGAYPQVVDLSFSNKELRISTDRILDKEGAVRGFVKLVQDRTREVELLRSKSEFITIAAHQLRTPLTAINWTLEGFKQNDALSSSDKELLNNGLAAAAKLIKIVNDLLDVSKIEEGRFGYTFKSVDIVQFINDVLVNAQVVAKEYGVTLYFDKGSEMKLELTLDPDRLGLALSNLIDNAIKYNAKNGSVTVRLARVPDKPYVQVSVEDTGIGVPPQDISKLFTRFFRSKNVIRRETEGSGLGLYITKNIISRHGGVIWAESVLDRGTTFYFTLPTDSKLIPPKEVGLGG